MTKQKQGEAKGLGGAFIGIAYDGRTFENMTQVREYYHLWTGEHMTDKQEQDIIRQVTK